MGARHDTIEAFVNVMVYNQNMHGKSRRSDFVFNFYYNYAELMW